MAPFSIRDALGFGGRATLRHVGLFAGLLAVTWLASLAHGGLASLVEGRAPALSLFFLALGQLVAVAIQMGWIRIALALHDGRPASLRDLVPPSLPAYLDFLGGALLYALLVGVGLVLLVVPGVYWAVKYGAWGFAIVAEGADPIAAFRRSAALTAGARGSLLLLGLAWLGLNLAGALAFGIGLLATLPITAMSAARVYRRLAARAEAGPPAPRAPAPSPA